MTWSPPWSSWSPTGTLSGDLAIFFATLNVILQVIALGVIPGNRRPATAMAWLLLIFLTPVFGLIAFYFLGSTRVGRERRRRQAAATAEIERAAEEVPDDLLATDHEFRAPIRGVVALNRSLTGLPLTPGNDVTVLQDWREAIPAMTAAIAAATESVRVEFYIAARDQVTTPLFDAMEAAANRGLEVLFLYDQLGSRSIPGYRAFLKYLAGTKIEARPMMPISLFRGQFRRPDLRNHRKLVVVDQAIGFMGSQNLIEPAYNKPANQKIGRDWVDLMVQLTGPVVAELAAVFASDWFFETGDQLPVDYHLERALALTAGPVASGAIGQVPAQIVPSGPGYESENNLRMFTSLVYAAESRISLTSPYFVPDESLMYAVTTAVERGVEVELFVSEQSDQFMVGHAQASYYAALLRAGVRIWLYPAPLVLHSKHFTIDSDVAVIGSSNMDLRSFDLNYEVVVMLVGEEITARLRGVEDDYRAKSRELTLKEWEQRPRRQKYVDNVMRLTSALQ